MSGETLPALLARRAGDSAAIDAVVDHDGRLDYATLDTRSAERAAWLVACGINRDQRVGLLMENGCEWVLNACALMRIGATLVPLSTLLRAPELEAQLALAGVRHLIATDSFRDRHYRAEHAAGELANREHLPSLVSVFWKSELGAGSDAENRALSAALSASVRPADDMAIIFTSGSSGIPKGVIHTHGGALRANAAGLELRCIEAGDRLYLPMPLFWAGGFCGGLVSALNAGATLLTEASARPEQTLAFLKRERVTLFRGWPDQAAQLAAHPDFRQEELAGLKPGSLDALLPPHQHSAPGRRASLFGMTETFGPCCGYPMNEDMPEDKAGSCGRPFPGIELRVVDPESAAELPPGDTGALQLRGRNLFRGICGQEREETFSADGWYASGDLARLDSDGFLYHVGRLDEMIKFRGVSIFPTEIAAAIEACGSVERAFVSELQIAGEPCIAAAILPAQPGNFDLAELQDQLAKRLSSFKLPSSWRVLSSLEELPRTPTGKIDKAALRTLLQAAP